MLARELLQCRVLVILASFSVSVFFFHRSYEPVDLALQKNVLYRCRLEGTSKLKDIITCDHYCKGWARGGQTAVHILSERPVALASDKCD